MNDIYHCLFADRVKAVDVYSQLYLSRLICMYNIQRHGKQLQLTDSESYDMSA